MENLTTLSQLQIYAKGQAVELPPFAEGQPFVAMLKRPSLLALAKQGRIPNELLSSAASLFESRSKQKDANAGDVLGEMFDALEAVCEASFVSPTYQEINDAGVELTDEQRAFVFQYAQEGVKALNNFREIGGNSGDNCNGEAIQSEAQSNT